MKEFSCGQGQQLLNCNLTVYCHTLFKHVLSSYYDKVDFINSLDLMLNEQRIISASSKKDGEGGKSGQMFFLTHDKRLILKTTNDEEAKLFISILKDYSLHFWQNSTSQIARIFGLFELEFSDVSSRNVKIFVMEAIGPPEQDAILRKYDLKGSSYDRQVERSYKQLNSELKFGRILKDTDF